MEVGPEYECRIADFRQVIDDKAGKVWGQILCRWCHLLLEQYDLETLPPAVPPGLILKIAAHSLACPELLKSQKPQR